MVTPKPVAPKHVETSPADSAIIELVEDKQDSTAPIVDVNGAGQGAVDGENESLESIVDAAAQVERAKAGGAATGNGVNVPPRMSSIAMVIPAKLLFGLGRA